MIKLAPVSPAAIDRLRNLVPMAPLTSTQATRAADLELQSAGWVELSTDEEDGAIVVDMAPAAYRPDGDSCLFDDRGRVHACWVKAA